MTNPTIQKFDTKTQKSMSFEVEEVSPGVYSEIVSLPTSQSLTMATALITPDADLTQMITVATPGTPVQGPNKTNPGGWMLSTINGTGYFMFHGQVKTTKGYPIPAGTQFPLIVSNLNTIDFDADSAGTKIIAAKIS
jgi:hypothetical protein